MINRNHSLSLVKQCDTLALARSGLYYQPKPESDADLKLMRLIDEIHLNRPFLGSRRITDALGTLRILEAIRILGLEKKTRLYQASSSELYGQVLETPQSETTPFYPRSPYAVAK